MKIALIGYGKMGRTIHEIAEANGDEVVLKIDPNGPDQLVDLSGKEVDVCIEFSNPESAFENISTCLEAGIPIISGTTGWLDRYDEIIDMCVQKDGTFLYASNFSIGVNIFFEVNKFLASKMRSYRQYKIQMKEIHHTEKLDAPSGTAITLAEGILEQIEYLKKVSDIEIQSERIGKTPGTHIVDYHSIVDSIEIKHTAHTRLGFAQGAYEAARWIKDKKGVFSIQDMLFEGK